LAINKLYSNRQKPGEVALYKLTH